MRFGLAGGTSPLAKDLANSLKSIGHEVEIFSRSPKELGIRSYGELDSTRIDALVNMIGGHSSFLKNSDIAAIISTSESFVDFALARKVPLIHISSGSVFGALSSPACSDQPILRNNFRTPYQQLKAKMEILHDANRHLMPIADLRLFSFAGTNLIRESNYFFSKLCFSTRENQVLNVEGNGFIRDFTGPNELAQALEIAALTRFSGTVNLFSDKPATRLDILCLFNQRFGLRFEGDFLLPNSEIYCACRHTYLPGFNPRSSMEVLVSEYLKFTQE